MISLVSVSSPTTYKLSTNICSPTSLRHLECGEGVKSPKETGEGECGAYQGESYSPASDPGSLALWI